MPNTSPPAARKKVHVPVRFRRQDEARWHTGHTESISRTGLIFRGDMPVAEGATLELVLDLPGRGSEPPPGELLCAGTVLRSATGGDGKAIVSVEFRSIAAEAIDALLQRL